MKKIKTLVSAMSCTLLIATALMSLDVSAVPADKIAVRFSGLPFRNIEMGYDLNLSWKADATINAPPAHTEILKPDYAHCTISTMTNQHDCSISLNANVFENANVEYKSVGDYSYELKLNNFKLYGSPSSGTSKSYHPFTVTPQAPEIVTMVRNADPESLSRGLRAVAISKDTDAIEITADRQITPSVMLSHKTSGSIGDKEKSFEYSIQITGKDTAALGTAIILSSGEKLFLFDPSLPPCRNPNSFKHINFQCGTAKISLKDGESALIGVPFSMEEIDPNIGPELYRNYGGGFLFGDEIKVSYTDSNPNYTVSVNGEPRKTHAMTMDPSMVTPDSPKYQQIAFESSRELPVNTGVIIKIAPFVILAALSGLGIFAIIKHRRKT